MEKELKQIIEYAVSKGWKEPKDLPSGYLLGIINNNTIYPIIFNHDFLKAYFGEEENYSSCGVPLGKDELEFDGEHCWCKEHEETNYYIKAWQYHATKLVLLPDKEKIEYLIRYL